MYTCRLLAPVLGGMLLAALEAGAQVASTPPGGAPPSAAAQRLPTITLPPDVDRVLRDYQRAWLARDARGLAALFTEDGFVLQMGRPPVRGRAAIEAAYAGQGGQELRLRALAYATSGSVGWLIGTYGYGDRADEDLGKYTLTLRRRSSDGRWLIMSDMDNPNQPPQRRPAPPSAPPPSSAPSGR
jgi:ketosteroid isomerase-like protein